jgi:predicted transcriptional regulator
MSLSLEEQERFAMLHLSRDLESVLAAVARRDLEPRDLAVLVCLISFMDRMGKVRSTSAAVAAQLGVSPSLVGKSITRLRQQSVIAKVYDNKSGETYFLVNPYVISIGGPQRRNHLWMQFKAALEDSH